MKLQLTVTRAALRGKEADLLTAERDGKRLSTELARLRNLVRIMLKDRFDGQRMMKLKGVGVKHDAKVPPSVGQ